MLYRTISMYLAEQGFVVAMLEHFGNNRNNNTLENTIENLKNRPRHVSLTIDAVLFETRFDEHILFEKIAVIGHSMFFQNCSQPILLTFVEVRNYCYLCFEKIQYHK